MADPVSDVPTGLVQAADLPLDALLDLAGGDTALDHALRRVAEAATGPAEPVAAFSSSIPALRRHPSGPGG